MTTERPRIVTGVHQCFLLVLSSGPSIPFDPDELPTVKQAIENGNICQLRRGFFNPSFFVSIVQDEKRYVQFIEDTKYQDDRSRQKRLGGMRKLDDIFAEKLKALPSSADG